MAGVKIPKFEKSEHTKSDSKMNLTGLGKGGQQVQGTRKVCCLTALRLEHVGAPAHTRVGRPGCASGSLCSGCWVLAGRPGLMSGGASAWLCCITAQRVPGLPSLRAASPPCCGTDPVPAACAGLHPGAGPAHRPGQPADGLRHPGRGHQVHQPARQRAGQRGQAAPGEHDCLHQGATPCCAVLCCMAAEPWPCPVGCPMARVHARMARRHVHAALCTLQRLLLGRASTAAVH